MIEIEYSCRIPFLPQKLSFRKARLLNYFHYYKVPSLVILHQFSKEGGNAWLLATQEWTMEKFLSRLAENSLPGVCHCIHDDI